MTLSKYHFLLVAFLCFLNTVNGQKKQDSVYFTTGFKIGEVSKNSAIIWTRLCKSEKPVPVWHERQDKTFRPPVKFKNNMPVNEMDGAVEGSFGQVRVELISKTHTISLDWEYVSALKDYTFKKIITNLNPNTKYTVKLTGRKSEQHPETVVMGHFFTAPEEQAIEPIVFTSSTCQFFWSHDDPKRGFKIYDGMKKLQPKFHVQTGDYVYYDKPGPFVKTIEMARHKWHAMNSWPSLKEFYMETPLYIEKDDHDLLRDDAYPGRTPLGEVTFEDGLALWYEQTPIGAKPYRTQRWGKDLQVWFVEVREFRSDNRMEDSAEKTIWGKAQIQWFKETIEASDATFKVLISPTPIVGPDRPKGKNDNHSNKAFQTEGEWLRAYLAKHKVFVVNGDRHWQYASVDLITGLREFSQGAVSDYHAGGWQQDNVLPEHKFLRVKGGFLTTKVYRKADVPLIEFLHYDVDGTIVHKETFKE
ncbi:alkaline phosphatase D family protein [Seonamhaeicola marinus]|uniref:Alkaline phosphatase n=1 Tax=Seonamhaeicola marinus TaxID=1912246 RepID=A0A5D0I4F9_9FLAO|nr:alkaline phosphatase D family protein [Seonamhaeicola marinus]TYA78554.1 alkaline phosphatase [Seonamhaeicola marinus]